MKTNQHELHTSGVTQLRVFRGDEADRTNGQRPSKPDNEPQRQWAQSEAYWAGRSPAGRLSARLAA
jgi:hypothetical protein